MKIRFRERAENQGRHGDLEHEIAENLAGIGPEQTGLDGEPADQDENEDGSDVRGNGRHGGKAFAALREILRFRAFSEGMESRKRYAALFSCNAEEPSCYRSRTARRMCRSLSPLSPWRGGNEPKEKAGFPPPFVISVICRQYIRDGDNGGARKPHVFHSGPYSHTFCSDRSDSLTILQPNDASRSLLENGIFPSWAFLEARNV